MHGSNRLGGNSLSDLLVFGKRAGAGAADYVLGLGDKRPEVAQSDIGAGEAVAVAPFEHEGGENPYTLHQELQQTMNDLVGIIRREAEIQQALVALEGLRVRAATVAVEGHRQFNPGWHLALDLRNMLVVSQCVALAALERLESRGGHTREDHPAMDPDWRGVNLICSLDGDGDSVSLERKPVPTIRRDLLELFERGELAKYLTEAEVARLDSPEPAPEQGSQA
jgi:succinate dehydrogenase / fumarate reductase flavoprotein subunit